MKLGIRAIRYVHQSNVRNFSMLPRGSHFNLNSFVSSTPVELPFTAETGDLKEQSLYDDFGHYSIIDFSASIRAGKDNARALLQKLNGKNHIFEIETIAGEKYIIGSSDFMPTFTFEDVLSGNSKNEFIIKIHCKSLHGALFNDF